MTEKPTGGPAFPRACAETSIGGNYEQDGMTLRDYFAAKAIQGICASGPNIDDYRIASEAYALADVMLRVRNRS